MNEPRRDTDASQRDTDESFDQLTVPEAADRLGLSIDATRMRIRRGTLPTTVIDGKKYVLVARSVSDEPRRDDDASPANERQHVAESTPDSSELVSQLRSEVEYLRRTLDAEIEARRRADHLVASTLDERRELTARIAALTVGAGEHETEHRLVSDETVHGVPQDANAGTLRGDRPQVTPEGLMGRLRRLLGRG